MSDSSNNPVPDVQGQQQSANVDEANLDHVPNGPSNSSQNAATLNISSLEDLRKKAPEIYQKMMEGIASSMISEQNRRMEHLKEMWRKAREDSDR